MPPTDTLSLHEWETFYVILGSSAAALTGLMFVVVALGAERRAIASTDGATALSSFGTPTVVHFCAALLVAALVTMPGQTSATLGGCLAAMGALGLLYGLRTVQRARQQRDYEPVLADWIWHIGLPFLAYAGLLASGLAMRRAAPAALYGAAAFELLVLFIGIHNAWDAAVWIATAGAREQQPPADASPAPPTEERPHPAPDSGGSLPR